MTKRCTMSLAFYLYLDVLRNRLNGSNVEILFWFPIPNDWHGAFVMESVHLVFDVFRDVFRLRIHRSQTCNIYNSINFKANEHCKTFRKLKERRRSITNKKVDIKIFYVRSSGESRRCLKISRF